MKNFKPVKVKASENSTPIEFYKMYLFNPKTNTRGAENFIHLTDRARLSETLILFPIGLAKLRPWSKEKGAIEDKDMCSNLVKAIYCSCLHLEPLRAQVYLPAIFSSDPIDENIEFSGVLLKHNVSIGEIKKDFEENAQRFIQFFENPEKRLSWQW